MLTNEEYDSLKIGDVVLWDGKPRIIRDINARFVQFAILHRSWTGRAYTVYGRWDVRAHCAIPEAKLRTAACERELAALYANGFDPIHEIERELKEDERMISLYPEDAARYKKPHLAARVALRMLERRKKKGL